MTGIEQTKMTNLIRHLLLFIVLIGFSYSNLDKTNLNSNLYRDTILRKLNSGDLTFLIEEDNLSFIINLINDEKKTIIDKKSLEGFNKTISYKLINEIYIKVTSLNNEILPIQETNQILKIFIESMSEISEMKVYNNFFYNQAIFKLVEIYSIYKDDDFNFENFNEKIIPIINKKIEKEKYEYENSLKYIVTRNFLIDCIEIFSKLTKKKIFFVNLEKNEKIKELFIKIIEEYICFIIRENEFLYYSTIIYNFFNDLVLEFIENNISSKKVYLKLIDCFLKNFIEVFNTKTSIDKNFDNITCFLKNLFKNPLYLKNITDLDILKNIFKKIADIELEKNKKKTNNLSMYVIKFYTKYILIISKENNEKNSKIIEIFEDIINEYILLIKSFEINYENYIFHKNRYNEIKKFLYHSNINYENDKFNNPNLINDIKYTLEKYMDKILMV